jgi:hypothetical protein
MDAIILAVAKLLFVLSFVIPCKGKSHAQGCRVNIINKVYRAYWDQFIEREFDNISPKLIS